MWQCPVCSALYGDRWGAEQCELEDRATMSPLAARRAAWAAALPRRVPGITARRTA